MFTILAAICLHFVICLFSFLGLNLRGFHLIPQWTSIRLLWVQKRRKTLILMLLKSNPDLLKWLPMLVLVAAFVLWMRPRCSIALEESELTCNSSMLLKVKIFGIPWPGFLRLGTWKATNARHVHQQPGMKNFVKLCLYSS